MYFICYHDAGIAFRSFSSGGIMADKRGGLWSRVRAEHWFCGHSEWPKKIQKESESYSDIRKCRKEFLKDIMGIFLKNIEGFSQKDLSIRKSFWGVLNQIMSSFFQAFASLPQKIEKTGLTCLKSYQGGMMRLSALCVW